jgi:hypothetical protein
LFSPLSVWLAITQRVAAGRAGDIYIGLSRAPRYAAPRTVATMTARRLGGLGSHLRPDRQAAVHAPPAAQRAAGPAALTADALRPVPTYCRVISGCQFAVQLNHFIPGFRSYSVDVYVNRQSDITLGADPLHAHAWARPPVSLPRRRRGAGGGVRRRPGLWQGC